MMRSTSTASRIPEPINVAICHVRSVGRSILRRCDSLQTDRFSRLHPNKLVKAIELRGSSCRTTSNQLRLINVSHTQQRGISPNHSRPRTSTRWPHPHLGTSPSLAPSNRSRTETTSFSTTITWLIVDSTQSSACSIVTLNLTALQVSRGQL